MSTTMDHVSELATDANGRPLSSPKTMAEIRTASIVILIVATLSAIGAAWMIVSFMVNKALRTFRHQLILGLAISDFLMAINFLSSAAVNLSGRYIGDKECQTFCSFNGFMIQTFVDQTDYWVLSIAACTFVMLNDKKSVSQWIQNNRVVCWILPWFFSLLWATLGLVLAGYGGIGPWCWFTSDRTRLLVNFLPRWCIIVLMLLMYARLHFVLHRAHNNFMSFDEEDPYGSGSHGSRTLTSATPRVQSVNLVKLSDNSSDQDRILPPTPTPPKPRSRRARGSSDLKRLSYQMMMYPLVYGIVWALPTGIRIYQAVTGQSAGFTISTIDKSCIVVQGLMDAIVYGFNEKTMRGWRELFRGKKSN